MASDPNSPEILTTQILGNVFIACIVLSNVPYFYKIEKSRDVGKFNIFPFVFMIGQAMMWVAYGTICDIQGLVPVNAFGMLFNLAFILIYMGACTDVTKKRRIMLSLMIFMSILVSFVLIVYFRAPKDLQRSILGWLTSILLVAFYLSPIIKFPHMFKKRTTGNLSLPLSIASIFAGVAFGLYGVFLEDNFVLVSNFSGTFSGIIQILFFYFMKIVKRISPLKNEEGNNDKKDIEERAENNEGKLEHSDIGDKCHKKVDRKVSDYERSVMVTTGSVIVMA
ncbi:hypothetical protein ACTFIV_004711 [Dictyostelium citrinum]